MRRQIGTGKYCGNCPCLDDCDVAGCNLYEKELDFQKTRDQSYIHIRLKQCVDDNPRIMKIRLGKFKI